MNVRQGFGDRAAVASLTLGRIVYAVNWFSLAAVFSFTASELNQNVSGLGVVTAAFFVGIGVFQVPGGILAAKIGPRLTAICGTTVASLASLLTGFAGNLAEIAVLRLFVGLGMAFVFAPGVILMSKFLHEGSEGLGVGLYNSAFSLGSVVGLSGWAVLAAGVGWRNSLMAGGLLGLFTSVLMWFLVPKDSQRSDFKVELRYVKLLLLDKWLVVLSIAMLGLQVGSTVYSSFTAYYLESVVHMNVGEAGAIASLVSLFALASAPFAGRLFDKYGNVKKLLLASGFLMVAGVGIASVGTVYSAVLAGVLVGSASGTGFTFGFSAARAANRLDRAFETLAVSWVDSICLFGNFAPTLLYSYFVIQYGYSYAWLYMAVLVFLLIVPLSFPRASRQKQAHDQTRPARAGGENLVRHACVINDLRDAAGNTGMGAVMGSKKLKAIAVKGQQEVEGADPENLKELARTVTETFREWRFHRIGTGARALVNATTGWNCTDFELMEVGERAFNLARCFNIREGFTEKDDCFPDRLFQPQTSGPLSKTAINPQQLEELKHVYYEMLG